MAHLAKWKKQTKEEFNKLVAESNSIMEQARKVGYNIFSGSGCREVKKAIAFYESDTSHFLGQGWNKNNYDLNSFSEHSNRKAGTAAKPLIYLRGRKCENCGITEWFGEPINLEVHHVNGDRSDNRMENLQLLCPNCHSYTKNFCYKSKHQKTDEKDFVEALQSSPNIRTALNKLGLTPKGENYSTAYNLIEKYNIVHLKERALRGKPLK